ncbi:MAG: FtsX-like permease family protein [Gammaproteobacteria bacterium]|nr:FtsX-like permease family protein [Gammaproteobacteria bacterium]MDH5659688.1 FtsX-like permease family protein [Gammaproteobacteria bacterium]
MTALTKDFTAAPAFSRLPMLIFVAWRNIWRNPIRSVLTISALASGLIMVILYASLLEGMMRQMVRFATEISTSHIQLHRQAYIDDQDIYATFPWSYMKQIEQDFPEVHITPRLYAAGLASSEDTSTGVLIKAVDPKREIAVTKMLEHVRHGKLDLGIADTAENGFVRYNLVIGAQLAKNMNVKPGDELVLVTQAIDGSIGNALYRVAAILKPLEPNFDRMGVLMSIEAYQQLMYLNDGFHELAIKVNDMTQIEMVQAAITNKLYQLSKSQPLDKLGGEAISRNWKELTPAISDMLEMSKAMVLVIGLIIISMASLGMLNTMLMAVHERTHEFGILLAIGMKRRWLLLMVLFESFFLSIVSAIAGSILGIIINEYFEDPGIDFSRSLPDGYDWAGMVFEPIMKGYLLPVDVLYACLMMMVVTMLASLIPSWRTVRLKPAEVMR